jgi:DNA-3-methyladenine glycosylase II
VTPIPAPDYWHGAKRALARRDRVLARIIRAHPRIALQPRGKPFFTLARSIVGQQISVKAAASIWTRLVALAPRMQPHEVLDAGHARLVACGLSRRKAEYVADLARHFADGTLRVAQWARMEDEAVIAELVQVRGIGRWTAEMFLIFGMLRPDVLPLDDLGLQRAISLNYFRGRPVKRRSMHRVAAEWAPWRSVATWYLWRSLDPIPVEY